MQTTSPQPTRRPTISTPLLVEVIAPLAAFYGLRALGADPLVALAAGAAITAANAVRRIVAERRIGGVQVFVLATMVISLLMALVSGNARILLVRNGWGTAALGIWILLSLFARRPFLYEAGRIALPPERVQTWERNWEVSEAFRLLLRSCSKFWGVAFLVDAALRVVMAATFPVDLVPLLDDVLLVVNIGAILLFQRFYGRRFLRRRGLRLEGVDLIDLRTGEQLR